MTGALTPIEIEALIRQHRLEAVLLMNGAASRVHMIRANEMARLAEAG